MNKRLVKWMYEWLRAGNAPWLIIGLVVGIFIGMFVPLTGLW